MTRPVLLLAVHKEAEPGDFESVTDVAQNAGSHRFDTPPLWCECVSEVEEWLAVREVESLRETMVLVLLPPYGQEGSGSDRVRLGVDWTHRQAPLLGLACKYPEVYWVFVQHEEESSGRARRLQEARIFKAVRWLEHVASTLSLSKLEGLIENHKNGFRTLFDPTGLRAATRVFLSGEEADSESEEEAPSGERRSSTDSHLAGRASVGNEGDSESGLPLQRALCIEDELDFCVFNGYVLFRRGYRTYVASTYKELKRLLGEGTCYDFAVVIQDALLGFSDAELGVLEEDAMLPRGHEHGEDRESLAGLVARRFGNFEVLQRIDSRLVISAAVPEGEVRGVRWATKPYGGIFSSEIDWIPECGCGTEVGSTSVRHGVPHDHSTPGAKKAIAEALLERAKSMLGNGGQSGDLRQAVHAAVLALEAGKLLDNKTSVMSLAALDLQQRGEAIAEGYFVGTSMGANAEGRLEDIRKRVGEIIEAKGGQREGWAKYELQKLDAIMHIATEVAAVYDAVGQFDEAEFMRREIARCEIDMLVAREAWRPRFFAWLNSTVGGRGTGVIRKVLKGLWMWPVAALKYYVIELLRSGWNIARASSLWLVFFGVTFFALRSQLTARGFVESLMDAGSFFVASSSPPGASIPRVSARLIADPEQGLLVYQLVAFLASACGLLHLGIFVAYVYSKLARK